MNYFNSKKDGVASKGYSFSLTALRNWVLVTALVFGLFASSLTIQTASAKTGKGSLTASSNQDNSGPVKSGAISPTLTYSKIGPATVKDGGTATYTFKITNSDPISYFGYLIDYYPSELTYTGDPAFGDEVTYVCFDYGSVIPTSVGIPAQAIKNVSSITGAMECIFIVQPNSTITITASYIATGSGGDCFTNLSAIYFEPYDYYITPAAISNIKSKDDIQKNAQAIASEPIPEGFLESDWITCIAQEAAKPPADLIAQLRLTPDRTDFIDPNGDISYTLSLKNQGIGDANRVQATFPFDSNLDVGYLTSLNPNVWVSAIDTTSAQHTVTVDFPTIAPGAVFSATLVMRPSATAATGASEFNRFTVKWDDAEKANKHEGSNGVRYSLSDQAGSTLNLTGGEVQLFDPATATVSNGKTQVINGDFFAPGEKVTAWYTAPDGTSTSLGSALAGPNGEISITLSPVNLTIGDLYNISAYGNRSGVYGSSVVTIGSGS